MHSGPLLCVMGGVVAHPRAAEPWLTLGGGRKGDPLELAGPVIAAAGTFGTGVELQRFGDAGRLGAIISPAVGRRTRRSPGGLQLFEGAAGLLMCGQFPTLSHRRVAEELAPLWRTWQTPVIVNLLADDRDACVEVASALADVEGVSAIEVSFVWPALGPAAAGWSPGAVAELTGTVAAAWGRPLIAKVPYGTGDDAALAAAAAEGGADAVTLGGGFPGQAIRAGRVLYGTLVGPCTKPLALHVVATVAGSVPIPLIASGGITTAADTIDFLQTGAKAVQAGSVTFRDPRALSQMADKVSVMLEERQSSTQAASTQG